MSFEKFKLIKQRSVDKISITSSHTFNFPTKFFKDNKLKDFKYVVIFFDKTRKAIGLQFTNDEEEKYKYILQKSGRGYGGFISATSFFKVNNIDPKVYKGRYEWKKEKIPEIGELFVIELKERGESLVSS